MSGGMTDMKKCCHRLVAYVVRLFAVYVEWTCMSGASRLCAVSMVIGMNE